MTAHPARSFPQQASYRFCRFFTSTEQTVVSIGAELLGYGILSGTHTTAFPKLKLLEILDMYN